MPFVRVQNISSMKLAVPLPVGGMLDPGQWTEWTEIPLSKLEKANELNRLIYIKKCLKLEIQDESSTPDMEPMRLSSATSGDGTGTGGQPGTQATGGGWITIYDVRAAPKGSFFLQATGNVLWKKNDASPGTWEQITGTPAATPTAQSYMQSMINWVCPSETVVGDCVFISGAGIVGLAFAASEATMPAYGFVNKKLDPTTCTVVFDGEINCWAGLIADTPYYVSPTTPGKMTPTPPSAAGQVVQQVLHALSDNVGYVTADMNDYYVL